MDALDKFMQEQRQPNVDDLLKMTEDALYDPLVGKSEEDDNTRFEGKPIFLADPASYDEKRRLNTTEDQGFVEAHHRVLKQAFDDVQCSMNIGSIETVESIEFWLSPVDQLTDGTIDTELLCNFTDTETGKEFQVLKKVPFESPV